MKSFTKNLSGHLVPLKPYFIVCLMLIALFPFCTFSQSLDYPSPQTAVQHKLTLTGSSTTIAIDANDVNYKACKDNLGGAHWTLAGSGTTGSWYNDTGGTYIWSTQLENKYKALEIPLYRNYHVYFEPDGVNHGLDMLAEVCNRNNIPQDKMIVCLEHYKSTSAAQVLAPSVYISAVNYCKTKGYGFKYWETSNEPQYCLGSGLTVAATYAQHVKDVYDAIKSVDSTAIVGCQINRKSVYSDNVLTGIDGKADFIAGHWYGGQNLMDNYSVSEMILADNFKYVDYIAYENQNIINRTGKVIPQIDTEWRLLADGYIDGVRFTGENHPRMGNIVGTIYQAVRLIYCIRDNYTQGACCWKTMGHGPGCLVQAGSDSYYGGNVDNMTSYLYWLYYYLIHNTGENVVDFSGSAPSFTGNAVHNIDHGLPTDPDLSYTGPLTPLMVTKSADGTKMFITVANGSTSATVPFSATISNFNIGTQTAVRIADTDVDQPWYQPNTSRFLSNPTISKADSTISCSLPPLSCTIITLTLSTGTSVGATGVTLNKESTTLEAGSTESLIATIAPSNASNKYVAWSSDNSSVASVDPNGMVTAIGGGVANITVTTLDGSFTDIVRVTVVATINIDFGYQFPSIIASWNNISNNTNGSIANLNNSAGSSTGISIAVTSPFASVNAVGLVADTALHIPENASKDSFYGSNSSCPQGAVTISNLDPNTPYSFVFFASREINSSDNKEAKYTAIGSTTSDASLNAHGNTSNVAIVSGIYPASNGTIVITAEKGANNTNGSGLYYFGVLKISYSNPTEVAVTGVTLNKETTTLDVYDTETLVATIVPANATNTAVIWSSNNTAVATVNGNGLVTPVGEGVATITVTTVGGSFTDTATVTVTDSSNVPVTGVSINKETTTLDVDATETLVATIAPANATNTAVTWSSDDTVVATVDGNGLITAVGEGEATITVTSVDGSFTDTAVVTVIAPIDVTINIDLGASGNTTPAPWNNLTNSVNGSVSNLINSEGDPTGISIAVTSTFVGYANISTVIADAALNIPSTASTDSFFGSDADAPQGAVTLTNLNTATSYSFIFYGARAVTSNRDTKYTVIGSTTSSANLNTANNTSNVATVNGIYPDSNGTIVITVEKGPNNNTSTGIYHFGVLKVLYSESGILKSATTSSIDNQKLQKISVYPNPVTNGILNINLENCQGAKIQIVNIGGEVVYTSVCSDNQTQISTNKMAPGIYLVKVITTEKTFVQKVVIK